MTEAAAQRLILKGGGSAALGFLIRLGARLLFVLMAGRLFGVALFGAFTIAVAVVELAVTLGGAGMKRQLFKLLDEERDGRSPPHVLLDAIALVTLASLVCIAPVMLGAILIADDPLADKTATALLLLAPMIWGQALLDLLLAATRWTHKMRHQVWARSIIEPYAGVAVAALAWALGFQATGLIVGYWAGTLGALGYALVSARLCLGPFSLRTWRLSPARLLFVARETALPTLSDFTNALAGRLDLYLVGLFLGESPAGIYGMARQVRTPIRQVRQSFDGLLTPIVSRTLSLAGPARTGQATASATRLILAIQLPMLIGLVAIGEPLLRWIGPEFAAGYLAMLLLAAAEAIQGAYGVSDLILLYRRPALILWLTAIGAAVNVAAGLILIPRFGVEGAAAAALAAYVAANAARRLFLARSFAIHVPLGYAGAPLLAGAAGLAVALALAGMPMLAFLAGLAAYGATLGTALRLGGASLSMTHFVIDAAAEDVTPPDPQLR
ncbi:MAG TPA: oligosaccharide flippase family protein [Allosphingosinicella sp.]|nr:oligosaccharide flippase family protein [Allosphingosinicella sp.]